MRLRSAGIRPFKIDVILISHLHGDHVFGLPGLLSSFSHLQRKEELLVFGPAGLQGLLNEIISYTETKITYPLIIRESTPGELTSIWQRGNLEILNFPLDHRISCNGYLLREVDPVRKLNKEKVESLKLPVHLIRALQRGEDIFFKGQQYLNKELTIEKETRLSYAYCSDTRFDRKILPWIRSATVLYHETTFRDDLKETAQITGHSTASEAAFMASEAGVSCLITGHYSSRYKDPQVIVEEAIQHFPNVVGSIEGCRYNLRQLANPDRE